MIDDTVNRILMSDSLRGTVPDLEDDSSQTSEQLLNSFIIVVLEMNDAEILTGSLDGISLEEKVIKLDVKLKIDSVYDLINDMSLGVVPTCNAIQLHLGEKANRIIGPFKFTSPKMFAIDHPNKLCVLGIDLIKI